MTDRKPFIAGNWKMNLNIDESVKLIRATTKSMLDLKDVDVLVAPPFTALYAAKKTIGDSKILLAAQNMHFETAGAFTGEVSGKMLREAGCTHVILGHSERRHLFRETSEMIDLKTRAANDSGLIPIVCIGESLEEREAGKTFKLIQNQLEGSLRNFVKERFMPYDTVLAYEPVWAIGTGRTATPGQAQEVHRFIREWLEGGFGSKTADKVRILYGGSVKPDNISNLMAEEDIDGALVGGASLKADSFTRLIRFQEE